MTGYRSKGFKESDNQNRPKTPESKGNDLYRKYTENIMRSPEAVVKANEKQDNEQRKIAEIVRMLENNKEMNKEQKLQKEEIIQNGITHISKSLKVYNNFVESLSEWPKDWVIEESVKNVEDKIRQITRTDVPTINDRVKVINTLLEDPLVREITQELLVHSENDRCIATRIANLDFRRVKDPKEKLQSFYHNERDNFKGYTIEESESARHVLKSIDAFEKLSITNEMQINKEVVDDENWENDIRNAMIYYSELKGRYNGESSDNKYPETVKSLIDEANLLDEKDKQQVWKESSSSHSTKSVFGSKEIEAQSNKDSDDRHPTNTQITRDPDEGTTYHLSQQAYSYGAGTQKINIQSGQQELLRGSDQTLSKSAFTSQDSGHVDNAEDKLKKLSESTVDSLKKLRNIAINIIRNSATGPDNVAAKNIDEIKEIKMSVEELLLHCEKYVSKTIKVNIEIGRQEDHLSKDTANYDSKNDRKKKDGTLISYPSSPSQAFASLYKCNGNPAMSEHGQLLPETVNLIWKDLNSLSTTGEGKGVEKGEDDKNSSRRGKGDDAISIVSKRSKETDKTHETTTGSTLSNVEDVPGQPGYVKTRDSFGFTIPKEEDGKVHKRRITKTNTYKEIRRAAGDLGLINRAISERKAEKLKQDVKYDSDEEFDMQIKRYHEGNRLNEAVKKAKEELDEFEERFKGVEVPTHEKGYYKKLQETHKQAFQRKQEFLGGPTQSPGASMHLSVGTRNSLLGKSQETPNEPENSTEKPRQQETEKKATWSYKRFDQETGEWNVVTVEKRPIAVSDSSDEEQSSDKI